MRGACVEIGEVNISGISFSACFQKRKQKCSTDPVRYDICSNHCSLLLQSDPEIHQLKYCCCTSNRTESRAFSRKKYSMKPRWNQQSRVVWSEKRRSRVISALPLLYYVGPCSIISCPEGHVNQARRHGGATGVNAPMPPPPPPPAEKVRLERAKDKLTRKKNAKDESFLASFVNARSFSQCRKQTWGCWSLITVFIILIYLPRPINSRNTIVRIGKLAVVFLAGNIFLETLNTHSRVKSLLKTSTLTYIAIIWHILFPITHTHFYCN